MEKYDKEYWRIHKNIKHNKWNFKSKKLQLILTASGEKSMPLFLSLEYNDGIKLN